MDELLLIYIFSHRSPCEEESLHQQITRAFNEACEEVQKQGGDSFTQTIEMWEFFNNFKGKLSSTNFIDLTKAIKDGFEFDKFYEIDCGKWPPCWSKVLGENRNKAVYFNQFCNTYKGFTFQQMNELGWFGTFNSQGGGPDPLFRYIIDPTNSHYVIDMRHLLYVGFYLQENFGKGNGLGDLIELGQLFFDSSRESALNWQDAFSNRLGTSFSKYLKDNPLQNPEDFVNRLCEFLDSPLALRLRPKLNLDDDDCK